MDSLKGIIQFPGSRGIGSSSTPPSSGLPRDLRRFHDIDLNVPPAARGNAKWHGTAWRLPCQFISWRCVFVGGVF